MSATYPERFAAAIDDVKSALIGAGHMEAYEILFDGNQATSLTALVLEPFEKETSTWRP